MTYTASDMWALWAVLTLERRKEILAELDADAALANHDWAGLPPQVQSGIIAGMPVDPPSGVAHEPVVTGGGKRKKADD
jgi:hypothetical protein